MTKLPIYIGIVVGFALSLVYVIGRKTKPNALDLVMKTIASLAITATMISAIAITAQPQITEGFALGALLCLLGDILLEMRYLHKDYSDKLLRSGVLSFMFAHFLYSDAIIHEADIIKIPTMSASVLIAVSVGLGVWLLEKPLSLDYGKFKVIIPIYGGISTLTATTSLWAIMAEPSIAHIVRFIGAIMFLISDIVLAFIYFRKGKDKKSYNVANGILYFSAQCLIALSLVI